MLSIKKNSRQATSCFLRKSEGNCKGIIKEDLDLGTSYWDKFRETDFPYKYAKYMNHACEGVHFQ